MAAGDNLSIDKKILEAENKQLENIYNKFVENPFNTEIDELGYMNTDFTAKLKTMIENLNYNNSFLMNDLKDISKKLGKIIENFEDIDEGMVENMEE